MPKPDLKALTRNGVEQIFNQKNLDFIDEFISPSIIDHNSPDGLPAGIEGYRLKVGAFVNAFPDLKLEYTHQIAEDNMIAGRFILTATHQGDLGGMAPTGKKVRITGHDQLRFEGDQVAEHWVEMDTLSMMQQLGAFP